jgi:hypothetical protein
MGTSEAARTGAADSTLGVAMLSDVIEVQYRGGHRLFLRFEDGVQGEVDLGSLIRFDGVFEPLKDPAEFAKVQLYPDGGTIHWPNGADIAPETLHDAVSRTRGPSLH